MGETLKDNIGMQFPLSEKSQWNIQLDSTQIPLHQNSDLRHLLEVS
ncbi:hypothetical protein P872_20865 [Rhodonellum psychrophilum GCM71 = DSM 17998]|uniref:Uncharacterized protein n=2 Tax=Rhodonellum TaxID=336827 RepID=U5BYT7_9BACT|nr:hypothetical protein P872_20865 [Rhodonellum psychrophilum GCM71 = DSM 17998]SDZ23099.1 hypothetical protein SAMN05444412_10824 [Rhodonellum ikkaensis]